MYKSLLGTEFTQTTKRNTKRSNTPSKASFESKLSSIERKVRKAAYLLFNGRNDFC